MSTKSKQVNVFVTLTDPETGELTTLEPGDTVPEKYDGLVGDHCFDEPEVPDAEVGIVAGPSQGLANVDQDALEKAKKAEASRRSRASKAGNVTLTTTTEKKDEDA